MRRLLRTFAAVSLVVVVVGCDRSTPSTETGGTPATAPKPGAEWTVDTRVDADGRLVAEVIPGPGYDINLEYPWKLTAGEQTQGMDDADVFDKKRARFVMAAPGEPGPVTGELRFSVCNDATCLTPRETLTWGAAE